MVANGIGDTEQYFNSRPHGGRLSRLRMVAMSFSFQLTPSRRATTFGDEALAVFDISTHALTEGDYLRSTRLFVD